jgi:hypothetical protein
MLPKQIASSKFLWRYNSRITTIHEKEQFAMKRDNLLCLGLILFLAAQAMAQEAKKDAPDEAAMMARWQAFATPGEGHAALKPYVGSWTASVKMWMQPGAPPQESSATSEAKWILGGRYIQEDVKTNFNGMPFEGRGTIGYDNLKKKYVGTWIDNMGTGIMTSEGTYDAATKTFANTSEGSDPMTGKTMKSRDVLHIEGNSKMVREIWNKGPDGKEYKAMEMSYTRKDAAAK